jgi:hypothetical protein
MHGYYRAIGFKRNNYKNVIRKLINKAITEYKEKEFDRSTGKLIEIFVQMGKGIGMIIHGEFLENGEFEVEYTFPFAKAKKYQYYDNILIEKNSFSYSFSGACDNDINGITVIFYLQNALDYVNYGMMKSMSAELGLSALSLSGKIILPLEENDDDVRYNEIQKENKNKLIVDAKNGNEEAIENLTFEEMDTYSEISKRVLKEDVLSIVESEFMPSGIECDIYSVIGKIIEYEMCFNCVTMEKIYNITVECNEIVLNVIINKDDLYGEPMVGRRFKGNIWLQGNVNFKTIDVKR